MQRVQLSQGGAKFLQGGCAPPLPLYPAIGVDSIDRFVVGETVDSINRLHGDESHHFILAKQWYHNYTTQLLESFSANSLYVNGENVA